MQQAPSYSSSPAVNAHQSVGNTPTLGQKIAHALESESLGYALSYSDPTGESAVRKTVERIRAALNWRPRTVNKLVMGPDKLPIHITDELCERLFIFLAVEASMKPTHSGKGFRADVKKNTPTAVEFGDMHSDEGPSTEVNQKEVQR